MNSRNYPRTIRIVCASLTMAAFCSAFGTGTLAFAKLAALQPGPQIVAVVSTLSASALVFVIVFFATTFLFGRFFCAAFCPLGILQDILGRFSFRKQSSQSNHRFARYLIAAAAFGALLGGCAGGFALVEPYSIFGKIAAPLLNPAFITIQRDLVSDSPASTIPYDGVSVLTGVGALIVLIALGVWKRRAFCTTVCPVGILLGLCSAKGWFKIYIKDACTGCGLCSKACPTGCIDTGGKYIDNERCVRCMNCMGVCNNNAIAYGVQPKTHPANVTDNERRAFLRGGIVVAVTMMTGLGARSREDFLPESSEAAILPPGAGSKPRFAGTCTSCRLCVSVCPSKIIRPSGQPFQGIHLDFTQGMCEFGCTRCADVCPTGALIPLTTMEKKRRRIGIAELSPKECISVRDRANCGACAEACPTGALRMRDFARGIKVPVMDKKLCIGCGACEYNCPAIPTKAIRVAAVSAQVEIMSPNITEKK